MPQESQDSKTLVLNKKRSPQLGLFFLKELFEKLGGVVTKVFKGGKKRKKPARKNWWETPLDATPDFLSDIRLENKASGKLYSEL